jgi:hypothetical protein
MAECHPHARGTIPPRIHHRSALRRGSGSGRQKGRGGRSKVMRQCM